MTNMFDVIDRDVYYKAIENRYVKTQVHPTENLVIHNYTDACTWDQAWDEATLNCRGLITTTDGTIIARGMPKFFNSDQEQAPVLSLDDEVIVSEKMDGSLGILYYTSDFAEAIATRGSFTSDQAVWATDWWRNNRPDLALESDKTYLFEIIYPENRIVVDYGDRAELVLLGTVDNETGKFTPMNPWKVESAPQYDYDTWAEVLSAPERPNAEGFVVYRKADSAMVKVKYEDYKRLHKYMTRVTERHVWECLMEERPLEAEFAGAPDEFHVWVREVADRLWADFDKRHLQIIIDYRAIRFGENEHLFEVGDSREAKKNFALAIKDERDKAYFFACYDDKSIAEMVWKELKPEAFTFRVVSSDAD